MQWAPTLAWVLPPHAGSDGKAGKLEASGSFLSRMLGRSPSKGSMSAPAASPAAAGQIQAQHPAMSGPVKSGVLYSTQPPGGSMKSSINQGSSASNEWSIGSNKEVRNARVLCTLQL
jgi:hypothetical protein